MALRNALTMRSGACGELGMGHIQADAHAGFRAELLDEVGIHEEVVITLPTEVPGEGGIVWGMISTSPDVLTC